MADSNITKRALAAALKELMEQKPFSKINVAEICEKCGMNRKSFYYHFKDKYDLVNWIFGRCWKRMAKMRISPGRFWNRFVIASTKIAAFTARRSRSAGRTASSTITVKN